MDTYTQVEHLIVIEIETGGNGKATPSYNFVRSVRLGSISQMRANGRRATIPLYHPPTTQGVDGIVKVVTLPV